MKAAQWNAIVSGVVLSAGVAILGCSYALDIFGIFHDPAGRQLSVQHNERTAKLMLNERYVPANFDALVIGGSSTSNWPMSKLDFAHFYNESIYGANAAEEKQLVDIALQRATFRYAICVINPYYLQSHDFKEGIGSAPKREALGSLNVLSEEFYMALQHLRHTHSLFSPEGGQQLVKNSNGAVRTDLEWTFAYDPLALQAFAEMLDELRARGTRIIFVETPVYEPVYEQHRAQFDRFYAAFPLRKPGEPLIDFNLPQYASFRAVLDRWVDPPHLNDASAIDATEELNRAIHEALPDVVRVQTDHH